MMVVIAGTRRIQFNFGFEVCWRPQKGREYEKMCLVLYLSLSTLRGKYLLDQWFPISQYLK
jgi:hypothetical protein